MGSSTFPYPAFSLTTGPESGHGQCPVCIDHIWEVVLVPLRG